MAKAGKGAGPKMRQDVLEREGRSYARTMATLARELNCEESVVRLLAKAPGNPGLSKTKMYDIEEWREFLAVSDEVIAGLVGDATGMDSDTKKSWDTRKVAAQARILELQEEERRGSVVSREEVVQVLGELIQTASRKLMQVPKESAAELAGLSLPEFTRRLGEIHRQALEDIYNALETKKKRFWQGLYAMLSAQQPKSSLGGGQKSG